jgi:purine-binding chemotaxis protein CheW
VVGDEDTALELLLCEVDRIRFGIPAESILELSRAVSPTPLRGEDGPVRQVINVRGRVVPLVDLRLILGLPPRPIALADHLIVARWGDVALALHVDRATELVQVEVPRPAPESGLSATDSPLGSVLSHGDGLLPVLSIGTLASCLRTGMAPAEVGFAQTGVAQ